MVLEIISGKRWTRCIQETYHSDLLAWAWSDMRRPLCCGEQLATRLRGFVHPSLHDVSFSGRGPPRCLSLPARRRALSRQREVRRCVRAALLCVQEKPERRPAMPEVVRLLSPRKARVPFPRRARYAVQGPLYAGERSPAAGA
ncbi:hypothetical protein ABZP36_009229 [Zizania latifolia]